MIYTEENKFKAKNEKDYFIVFDDEGETVEVFDNSNSDIVLGHIDFVLIENELHRGYSDYYYLVQCLALDNCKRIGIGTEIFKRHTERFELPIIARENDGQRWEDGSHLTGDGVPFIEKMREKGYVVASGNDYEDD